MFIFTNARCIPDPNDTLLKILRLCTKSIRSVEVES